MVGCLCLADNPRLLKILHFYPIGSHSLLLLTAKPMSLLCATHMDGSEKVPDHVVQVCEVGPQFTTFGLDRMLP